MVGGAEGGQDNNLMTDAPTVGGLHNQEFSNLHGELSIWNDLRRTLAQLKSPQGKVMVSESTTSVTVQDHPENMAQIANYIAQLNKSLSVQVGIKVQVLEIQLDSAFNLGINWNLVFRNMNPQLRIGGALADATNPDSSLIGTGTDSGTASFQIGNAGSHALLQALGQQGKLRVVTKPQVVTMNNQIAAIRITKNTGYIKSISNSNTINYVATSITPGTVTDGFQLYLLPKVSGDKVFMQISSTISNLLSIQKESTAPVSGTFVSGTPAENARANTAQQVLATTQQYSAIELPTITEKSFNQRSVIQSGHTLVIAGFKRLFDQASNSTMANVIPGSKGAQSQNVETLVLITPVIMRTN
jgi:type IVB pilus formation R64 PilN family outer membrane protein